MRSMTPPAMLSCFCILAISCLHPLSALRGHPGHIKPGGDPVAAAHAASGTASRAASVWTSDSSPGRRPLGISEPLTEGEDLRPGSLRLVLCSLVKNEVAYMIEWIEFHRLMGFSHIAVYDDNSTDNAMLAEALYREHGRDYLSMHTFEWHEDARQRRAIACGACFAAFRDQADWIIHFDVDEFVWSPKYPYLPQYFLHEVPADTHILYVGASRFGWERMRKRHTWSLELGADAAQGQMVQLVNPNGLQLLTQTHMHRAPDKRFGEPEELLKDSNEKCLQWKAEHGRMSPCTNDNENVVGKTFVRGSTAEGAWTHGGAARVAGTWYQLDNGLDMHTDKCPSPICERSDPALLHVYHFRNPSLEDMRKKDRDWSWTPLEMDEETFAQDTWFFNLIRDVSLQRFGDALRARIAPLMDPPAHASNAVRHRRQP